MIKWFHHLFNPHCEECKESKECKSCETLRVQLERANYEKQQLLELILRREQPDAPMEYPSDYKPIKPTHIPFAVRRQTLEREDRERAKILREKEKEMEEIEKEIGIVGELK